MTRIVERLEDYRPLLAKLLPGGGTSPEVLARYRGTELVDCHRQGCHRAVIAAGPYDWDLVLEIVDSEGWRVMEGGRWLCPREPAGLHHDQLKPLAGR